MNKKVSTRNLAAVLARLTHYALNQDVEGQQAFCRDLNVFLDALSSQDAFGTEGQIDPRGDQRE